VCSVLLCGVQFVALVDDYVLVNINNITCHVFLCIVQLFNRCYVLWLVICFLSSIWSFKRMS